MIRTRNCFASLGLAAIAALATTTGAAVAGGTIESGSLDRVADPCAQFGADFVAVGNGVCARVEHRVRIWVRPLGTPGSGAAMAGWSGAGATSTAALRSYEQGMVPGAEVTQRLRVHGTLDSYGAPLR